MTQLDLFSNHPLYDVGRKAPLCRQSTPAQRRRAHRHAGSTVMVTAFINRRFGK
jgi:hypothetical protein